MDPISFNCLTVVNVPLVNYLIPTKDSMNDNYLMSIKHTITNDCMFSATFLLMIPSSNNFHLLSVNNCGGELTETSGELTSPNFPGYYGNQMECQWLITVDTAFTLQLEVYSIDLDVNSSSLSLSGCSDSLQVWGSLLND